MLTALDHLCRPLILLICLTVMAGCNNRNPPVEHSRAKPRLLPFQFTYYDYGGPPELHFSQAQAAVLKKYDLSYQGFGCVVTDSLIRAVRQHNDSLFALLQPAYPGMNEDRLQQEIQTYVDTQPSDDRATHR